MKFTVVLSPEADSGYSAAGPAAPRVVYACPPQEEHHLEAAGDDRMGVDDTDIPDDQNVERSIVEIPVIHTRRLELAAMSPQFIEAVLSGRRDEAERIAGLKLPKDFPGEHARFLRTRLPQMQKDPSAQPWLMRAMVSSDPERMMVGHIGFHARPDDGGAAEMGYTVMPEFRRRGYATEAAQALMDWAARKSSVRRFIVSISPGNAPSLAMAAKLGFRQTGQHMDEEDGLELVFELLR